LHDDITLTNIKTTHATSQEKQGTLLLPITLPNVHRFSKFFHHQAQQHTRNESVNKDPTTSQMHRYTTL